MSRFYWLELRFFYFFLGVIYILFFYYLFIIIYRRNGGYFACKKSLFCSSRELVLCFGVDCLLWEQSFISVNLRKEPLFDSKRTSTLNCIRNCSSSSSVLISRYKLKRKQSLLYNTVFPSKWGRGGPFWTTTDNGNHTILTVVLCWKKYWQSQTKITSFLGTAVKEVLLLKTQRK